MKAYYSNTISKFIEDDTETILGKLHEGITDFNRIWTTTTISWSNSIAVLKKHLLELIAADIECKDWSIILEYEIPRLLARIDIIIIAKGLIFVIEYKDEKQHFANSDIKQVEDYAMDLSDFHFESRDVILIPILLCTTAASDDSILSDNKKFVKQTIKANKADFSNKLISTWKYYKRESQKKIKLDSWINSKYSPTPNIIQAAQAIFAGHNVESITKSGADEINLTDTTTCILEKIEYAKRHEKNIICLVTGVPGAGKTLVGLDLIHRLDFNEHNEASASYFSGNSPLIEVLQFALNESEYEKELARFKLDDKISKPKKDDAKRKIGSKIQNLHNFIKDGLKSKDRLFEKIVVFDEAQRCWNAKHFYNKTKRNNTRQSSGNILKPVEKSEVELLFEIMGRHTDWSFIVALVGSGQEINTGEAGIEEWERVLKEIYTDWDICISSKLIDGTTTIVKDKIFDNGFERRLHIDDRLHLSINQRSFKANNLNEWVNALLDNRHEDAAGIFQLLKENYPVFITRELSTAKKWLKERKQGNKKIGLIASSGANRLKPFGVFVKGPINVPYWFFNDENDIRSSDFLECVATEFVIQGLEIDWTCLCWDIDLYQKKSQWAFENFSGTKWLNVSDENVDERKYILNTYRVLLTRAREGIVIWVPEGCENDVTRPPRKYDKIFEYLKACGVPEI